MRHLHNALHIIAGGIALYFALTFGADATRILLSPVSGFEDAAFVRSVYGAGHLLGLGPAGLTNAAAFFAVLKLAVACVFMLMVFERLRCLRGEKPDGETLRAALLLLLFSTELTAVSAVLGGAGRVTSLTSLQFFLAGAVVALSLYERRDGECAVKTRVQYLDAARGCSPRAA